jgi:hypothetical protein
VPAHPGTAARAAHSLVDSYCQATRHQEEFDVDLAADRLCADRL